MFTDTHCHVYSEYYDDIPDILKRAKEAEVERIIINGSNDDSNREIIGLVNEYPNMYGAIGIHPHDVLNATAESLKFIEENIKQEKIVAIGEIGLDYYYGKDTKKQQLELFEKQLNIAEKYNMPVIIHSREATKDTIDVLKKYKVKGVIHSFSGSLETALEYIKMGFCLGINGVITFKNSKLYEVIEKVDLEYIILETDCPYLTPVPYRGKQNEPAYIKEIAEYIAKLDKISLQELAEITNNNIKRIFDI